MCGKSITDVLVSRKRKFYEIGNKYSCFHYWHLTLSSIPEHQNFFCVLLFCVDGVNTTNDPITIIHSHNR